MIPKIVIVGRPNVGKSSLLNLLAGRRVSIVDPTAGVTRDRVSTYVDLPGLRKDDPLRPIELIDTGGWGIKDSQNLTAQVEQQITRGMAEAHVILFVVDAQAGVLPLDLTVAQLLHRTRRPGVPILLLANKVDDPSHEAAIYEAARLGFGEPFPISATVGYQKHGLLELLRETVDGLPDLPQPTGEQEVQQGILLAVVGKRNAGKSTLVNALAGDERVIVSEVEGTTRDSVDVRFEVEGHVFTAIDTAGVRKRKSLEGDIEFYSHHRALRSIRRADVVLLMVDATLPVSQVDKQLSHEILKHYKPTVVVVNKWDLAEQRTTQEEFIKYFDEAFKGLTFAPLAFISAARGEGVRDVLAMAQNLYQQAHHRVSTGELNRVIETILGERAPSASRHGKRAKIYYATQLTVAPPTIGLFVNDPELFDGSYQRFLINRMRDELPFAEVPIQLLIRPRTRSPKDIAPDAASAADEDAS